MPFMSMRKPWARKHFLLGLFTSLDDTEAVELSFQGHSIS